MCPSFETRLAASGAREAAIGVATGAGSEAARVVEATEEETMEGATAEVTLGMSINRRK